MGVEWLGDRSVFRGRLSCKVGFQGTSSGALERGPAASPRPDSSGALERGSFVVPSYAHAVRGGHQLDEGALDAWGRTNASFFSAFSPASRLRPIPHSHPLQIARDGLSAPRLADNLSDLPPSELRNFGLRRRRDGSPPSGWSTRIKNRTLQSNAIKQTFGEPEAVSLDIGYEQLKGRKCGQGVFRSGQDHFDEGSCAPPDQRFSDGGQRGGHVREGFYEDG